MNNQQYSNYQLVTNFFLSMSHSAYYQHTVLSFFMQGSVQSSQGIVPIFFFAIPRYLWRVCR